MATVPAPLVEIHTNPDDVPSIPPWFAELILLARHFTQRGMLVALAEHVRLPRGRAGHYDVIDFVAVLLGYALSGEPTLEAFFDRLAPFAQPFMALFGRDQLPHRSTLSRFLADVDPACLEALRQQFTHDLGQHRVTGELLGGLVDHQGHRLLVFDVDGTRQAARQRALVMAPDYPPPRRRLAQVCAPGYLGRKRGEVVRTRTTVLQAHTQHWLGTSPGLAMVITVPNLMRHARWLSPISMPKALARPRPCSAWTPCMATPRPSPAFSMPGSAFSPAHGITSCLTTRACRHAWRSRLT